MQPYSPRGRSLYLHNIPSALPAFDDSLCHSAEDLLSLDNSPSAPYKESLSQILETFCKFISVHELRRCIKRPLHISRTHAQSALRIR